MSEKKTKSKIKLTLSDSTGEWTEEYPAPVEQEHMKWADKLVRDFNEHLRQGELRRTLVSVQVVTDEGKVRPVTGHDWQQTDSFRVYKCANCGITGKRQREKWPMTGLKWPPTPDPEFKGRFFGSCDVAREYMPLDKYERMVYRNRVLGQERSKKLWERRRNW